jgi:hypothetical protein
MARSENAKVLAVNEDPNIGTYLRKAYASFESLGQGDIWRLGG